MYGSKEQRVTLDSQVLTTALLDEIAGRLLALEAHNKEISPEGIVEPLPILNVTTTPVVVQPPQEGKHWFSLSVVNDGPQPCWIVVNTGKSSTRPYQIQLDEIYEVTFIKPLIYDMRLYTDAGIASVRIKGAR